MSDYDPFTRPTPSPVAEPEPIASPTVPGDAAPKPTGETIQAPPGLGVPVSSANHRGVKISGAVLQGIGGFQIIACILMLIMVQTVIEAEHIQARHGGGSPDVEELTVMRAIMTPVLLIGGSLFLAAGTGVLYQQEWARVLGIICLFLTAVSTLLTLVVPLVSILAAVPLMQKRHRGWFQ